MKQKYDVKIGTEYKYENTKMLDPKTARLYLLIFLSDPKGNSSRGRQTTIPRQGVEGKTKLNVTICQQCPKIVNNSLDPNVTYPANLYRSPPTHPLSSPTQILYPLQQ